MTRRLLRIVLLLAMSAAAFVSFRSTAVAQCSKLNPTCCGNADTGCINVGCNEGGGSCSGVFPNYNCTCN